MAGMGLGQGGRFQKLQGELEKKGARTPGALAAWIGRRKYGKEKFQKLAGHGRSVHAGIKSAIAKKLRE